MPGFGSGTFGVGPFGEWDWSWYSLYGSIPSIYRDYDTTGLLESFFDGLRPSFNSQRSNIRSIEDIRDPLRVRTQYSNELLVRLGERTFERGTLWQVGTDGTISSLQEFYAESGRFRVDDIGRDLVIINSSNANNNKIVSVLRVLDEQTLLTDPPLIQDTGYLLWELRDHVDPPDDVITVQVREGYVGDVNLGWILFDGRGEFEVVGRRHFSITGDRQLYVENYGDDGYIDSSGRFVSVAGDFKVKDVGKKIVIKGMPDSNEDGEYEITKLIGTSVPYTLELDTVLSETPSYLEWSIRPWAELDLRAKGVPPRGNALQGASDLEVTATTVKSDQARFTASDVGNTLQIIGSQLDNDGVYEIASIISINEVSLSPSAPSVETDLAWLVREPTGIEDATYVRLRPPSMISYLAKDFGIEVDSRESELVQRKWVKNVSQWISEKGGYKGYEVVGDLSDLIITASKLYRIDVDLYNLFLTTPGADWLLVGDPNEGRFGNDGTLEDVAGKIRFSSPTSTFYAHDVGRHMRFADTQYPANSGPIFTIESVIDSNTVEFRDEDIATTPDYGSLGGGTIQWYIIRLYTTKGPTLPAYEDLNSDLMRLIVDGDPPTTSYFLPDKFSWESDWVGSVPVNVLSATKTDDRVYEIRVETPAGQAGSADVITGIGNWSFTDSSGNTFYVETLPEEVAPGEFTFDTYSTLTPSGTGAGTLDLICDEQIFPKYAPSNKIFVTIELGSELAGVVGLPTENILDRAFERIEQAKPKHIEVVFRFVQTISASVGITATIEPHPNIGAISAAYLSPTFDFVAGDAQVADHGLYASVNVVVTP